MYILGLTGGIGCGKTTVAGYLKEFGWAVVDADAVSRALTAPGGAALAPIRATFGDAVFFEDGTLNRKALAKTVFGHPQEREKLNAITHPMILEEMRRQTAELEKAGCTHVVWDVPLLIETGFDRLCTETVCVVASREQQIARLLERDGLSREDAEKRIDSQMPLSEKAARCTGVIQTCPTLEELKEKVRAFSIQRLPLA